VWVHQLTVQVRWGATKSYFFEGLIIEAAESESEWTMAIWSLALKTLVSGEWLPSDRDFAARRFGRLGEVATSNPT
jgi:hypothetical protein